MVSTTWRRSDGELWVFQKHRMLDAARGNQKQTVMFKGPLSLRKHLFFSNARVALTMVWALTLVLVNLLATHDVPWSCFAGEPVHYCRSSLCVSDHPYFQTPGEKGSTFSDRFWRETHRTQKKTTCDMFRIGAHETIHPGRARPAGRRCFRRPPCASLRLCAFALGLPNAVAGARRQLKKWLWLKKPEFQNGFPGKWKHGPKPAVCPSCLILSHTQLMFSQTPNASAAALF